VPLQAPSEKKLGGALAECAHFLGAYCSGLKYCRYLSGLKQASQRAGAASSTTEQRQNYNELVALNRQVKEKKFRDLDKTFIFKPFP
jgi:hypothetical protein